MTTRDQEPSAEPQSRYPWVIFTMLAFLLAALNISAIFKFSEIARAERDTNSLLEESVHKGAATYIANCSMCHGSDGKGNEDAPDAPGLNDKEFLSSVSDDFLQHTIADGRPRTDMPTWSQDEGGPLTMQEIDQVVTFIRNWEKPVVELGRTQTASGLPADSVEGGQETFVWFCAECHSEDGKLPAGSDDIVANSPERLLEKTEEETRIQILEGGEEMPGLAGILSPAELDGLIKFIATWPR